MSAIAASKEPLWVKAISVQDPLFVDPNNGDYHLQSMYGRCLPGTVTGQDPNAWVTDPNHSPCIDAGLATRNPMRESMPNGGRINMGAYGGNSFCEQKPVAVK